MLDDPHMDIALWVVVLLEFAGLVTLGVLLLVARRRLASARKQVVRRSDGDGPRRRRRPMGVAPLAIKTVANTVQTADSIIRRQLGASVRSSIEDLAGWARVERPDLARITADGRVVLVFSDIEGSTQRNATLGDRDWVELLERHEQLIRRQVTAHRGFVVKNQGDGFMIAFPEPAGAVRCCIAVQQALLQDGYATDGIRVRTGVHVGTSVRRGDDLFGLDVATAARVADLADGGQILVSEALRGAVGEDAGIDFGTRRDVELKGLPAPQTVYAVEIPRS
ncbi:adenylate/guanylate cyclase domain-containing protein [Mycolicibacterium monacense]|nr:adenylate/guanylate cyclase domain-containing protein [Mycolicibacterium monacense]MDA4103908.1 cyclase [Mycolicibacterium monacense DSM 44395]ORB23152.1 adenylate/guanylate cyclase domain-containing protein [Mycolicibacterium monacense DSM 44395]QHP85296.1 adenylate/guanylate cyclase domain-containing protein [Mycolicibacterium monacense DSM 44395]